MQKKRKDNQFIKQAYYEGGNTAFRKFVSENMKYPKDALKNDIEGIVHLKIDINHKGKVTAVKVMKGIGHGCDKEAVRIIKLAEYEVPANPKKLRVTFHKNVRIQFKKPKEQAKPVEKIKAPTKTTKAQKLTISYQLSPSKKQVEPGNKESAGSYSYTIKYNS